MMAVALNSPRSNDPAVVMSSMATNSIQVVPNTKQRTHMKLSPDSVSEIIDPTTVECNVRLRMPTSLSKTEKLVPINDPNEGIEANAYNLPPLRTPLHTKRKPPIIPLIRLDSPSLSKLPEDGTIASSEDCNHEAGGSVSSFSASRPPPPPPEMPKPVPISARRSQSDTLAQTKSNQRRSIFGHYFNQHQDPNRLRAQSHGTYPLLSRREPFREQKPPALEQDHGCKLSSSKTILQTASMQHVPIDYRMFAPPRDYVQKSTICGRFRSVEDVHLDLDGSSLPPFPSPLRRFCSSSDVNRSRNVDALDGNGSEYSNRSSPNIGGMHGMYPLITPVPILRQSSYSGMSSSTTSNGKGYGWFANNSNPSYLNNSFNLTESNRSLTMIHGSKKNFLIRKTSSSTASSTSAISDDSVSVHCSRNSKQGVRFDPRVTVTEFEDAVERVWYDDNELERLKIETIRLAQKYLTTHPMEAEKYNQATMDPVTQTYRKRALFSLPVLSSGDVDSENDTNHSHRPVSLSSLPSDALEELSKDQVKRILIVDPNPLILLLFEKSMSSMFPTADIVTAQNAERALKIVKASLVVPEDEWKELDTFHSVSSPSKLERGNAFDIIIIEQSLFPQSPHVGSHKTEPGTENPTGKTGPERNGNEQRSSLPWNASMPDMQEKHPNTFLSVTKPGSFFHHDIVKNRRMQCREPQCGSDLTGAIVDLMNQFHADSYSWQSPSTGNDKAMACSLEWKALLIGVSMHPDHHAKLMRKAGSDIVWGKPIPHVGETLRNQLLEALLDKRRSSSSSIL
ncbi:hypothetical protein IV203_035577 [Nitzschia inconspicua]|uniref:Uncharacterized protein n=1 Tax=Nitzschia inconspicua TaxID=303405 RepID=A0A9K3PUX7_9STRA|nr:hypothetical protein IV203_035577 [Nitzschia inconspicua]